MWRIEPKDIKDIIYQDLRDIRYDDLEVNLKYYAHIWINPFHRTTTNRFIVEFPVNIRSDLIKKILDAIELKADDISIDNACNDLYISGVGFDKLDVEKTKRFIKTIDYMLKQCKNIVDVVEVLIDEFRITEYNIYEDEYDYNY